MLKSITWQSWATPTFGAQDLIPGSVTSFFSPKQVKKQTNGLLSFFNKSVEKITIMILYEYGPLPDQKIFNQITI